MSVVTNLDVLSGAYDNEVHTYTYVTEVLSHAMK